MLTHVSRRRVRQADVTTCVARDDARTTNAVLQAFHDDPRGLTDDELVAALVIAAARAGEPPFHPPTVKSARSRLKKAGLLEATGERRPSRTGASMQVWQRVQS